MIQTLAPLQRDGSVWDWLADVVGIALGLLLWAGLTRRRSG